MPTASIRIKSSCGEVWFLNLDPTQDREQADGRPALVISVDAFNHGPADTLAAIEDRLRIGV